MHSGNSGAKPPLLVIRGLPLANLVTFIAAGVALLWWVRRFTEAYEAIGGVLALTGAFSWLAFVLKVLPEEKVKQLQDDVYNAGLNRPWMLAVTVSGSAVLLVVACFLSSIQLEPLKETTDRSVWIEKVANPAKYVYPERSINSDFKRLAVGSNVRWCVWVRGFGSSDFIVKVSGYPDRLVRAGFFSPEELYVPDSFLRPVVLLRPTPDLIKETLNEKMRLEVQVGIQTYARAFDGHAVWIGCDGDVQVPHSYQQIWKGRLPAEVMDCWLAPQQLSSNRFTLEPNTRIEARILRLSDGGVYTRKAFVVQEHPRRAEFQPQVEDIEVPKDDPNE